MCEREVTVVCDQKSSVPVRVPVGAVAALAAVAVMVWAASAVASAAEAVGVAVLSVCAVAAVGTGWFAVRHRVPAPAVVRATVHTPARRALPAPRRAISGPRATVTVTENIYERVAR